MLSNDGGLPTQPQCAPTCTSKGLAGFWVYMPDTTSGQPFVSDLSAIARAIVVDKCDPVASYDVPGGADFPIGGGNAASTCNLLKGCGPLFPLVVCPLKFTSHSPNAAVVNPGYSTFIRLISQAPLQAPL